MAQWKVVDDYVWIHHISNTYQYVTTSRIGLIMQAHFYQNKRNCAKFYRYGFLFNISGYNARYIVL